VTLAAIARETDGKAYRASSASKVESVYKQLGSSIAQRSSTREVSSWFAGAAAFLLLASLGAAKLTGARLP
jgi:Ca-activated chloride channel family protein